MSIYSSYKKFLFSACASILIGAGAVTTLPGSAQGKDAKEISPMGGWSVSQFGAGGASADGYCALTRSYSQDMVLTLGQNVAEEYSLAIDFQDARLDVDKAYSVTLQPGPSQIRAYEMMPASKKAMVIRLGYDNSFMKALKESSLLKAEIDKIPYHFTVTDLPAGLKDLDNCLVAMKGGASSVNKVASAKFSAEKVDEPLPPIKTAPAVKAPEVKAEKTAQAVKQDIEEKAVQLAAAAQTAKGDVTGDAKVTATEKTSVAGNVEKARVSTVAKEAPYVATRISPETETVRQAEMVPDKKMQVEAKQESRAANKESPIAILSAAKKDVSPAPVNDKIKTAVKEEPQKKTSAPPSQDLLSGNSFARPRVSRAIEISKVDSVTRSSSKMDPSKKISKETPETTKMAGEPQWQKKQRAEIEQLRQDNERLSKALQTQESTPVIDKQDAMMAKEEKAAAEKQKQEELQRLARKIGEEKRQEVERLTQSLEQIRAENEKLRMTLDDNNEKVAAAAEVSKEGKEKTDILMEQIANLREENTRLSAALQSQTTPMKAPEVEAVDVSPMLEDEEQNVASGQQIRGGEDAGAIPADVADKLAQMQSRMQALEEENKKLAQETKQVMSRTDSAVVDMGSQAFKRIREYEKRLEAAQQDNLMLSRELESLRRMQENVQLTSVAGDWDLERATKRYNEAEREIKRLGMLLEQQRTIHQQEKTELEQMLFDPAVTDEKQRQRLAQLESRLAMAEGSLGRSVQSAGRALSGYAGASYGSAGTGGYGTSMTPSMPERVNVAGTAQVPVPVMPQTIPRASTPVDRSRVDQGGYVSRQNQRPIQQAMQQPVSQAPVAVQQVPSASFSAGKLQTLLKRAGLPVTGNVSEKEPGTYGWRAGEIMGEAEVVSAAQNGSLDSYTQRYIDRAKQSCGGDFASIPGSSTKPNMKAYEIACVGQTGSMSSSIVVMQQGTEYVVISHNASTDKMDMAMDARDRILTSL